MAVEHATNETDHGNLEAHVRDYSKFIRMLKVGSIVSFILAMLVLVIISN